MFGIQHCHFVCVACRRCAKGSGTSLYGEAARPRCPQCSGEMIYVGQQFAAPRRRDDAGWKKLAWMIQHGWRGTDWPTAPAMNLDGVRECLETNEIARRAQLKAEKTAQAFETVRRRARWNFRKSRASRKRERLEWLRQRRYQDAVLARVVGAQS